MSDRYKIVIQPEAEQEIKDAYFWLSNYSPRQARSWLEGLYKSILSLEMMPLRCSLAFENDFFEEEIRQLIYGKGRNAYRILNYICAKDKKTIYYMNQIAKFNQLISELKIDLKIYSAISIISRMRSHSQKYCHFFFLHKNFQRTGSSSSLAIVGKLF